MEKASKVVRNCYLFKGNKTKTKIVFFSVKAFVIMVNIFALFPKLANDHNESINNMKRSLAGAPEFFFEKRAWKELFIAEDN